MSKPRVWFTLDRQRFFSVPEGTELPDGELMIRAFGERPRGVDTDAIAGFEIDRDAAAAAAGEPLAAAWSELREKFGAALSANRAKRGQEAGENPLPADLSSVLGVDPGAFTTDAEAISQSVSHIFGKIGEALKSAAPDPERSAEQQARIDGFEARLEAAAADPEAAMQAATERLRGAVREAKLTDALDEMSTKLRDASERLREALDDPEAARAAEAEAVEPEPASGTPVVDWGEPGEA